jgi:pteridine reductase
MELTGRVALVTGAGVRLGRALSEGLAGRGMRLALHYNRHAGEARELAERLCASAFIVPQPAAECFAADLDRPESAVALIRTVEERLGPIEILVLSAGVYPREPLPQVDPARFESTLRVNLTSPFFLAKEAGLLMKARGSGHIIAVLDHSLDRPYTDRIPYTIAKAGLRAGVLGLARALAPQVRVNAIAPGAVLLPEGTDEDLRERIRKAALLQRIGNPRDVVEAALYLIDSEFVTGSVLTVDGGRAIA